MAHFALSYVLRYGGMLDEAAHECDKAVSLDPGNYQFRSCSLVFDLMGNSDRAMDFLRLDRVRDGSRRTCLSISNARANRQKREQARRK